jgi:Icc-related predicted phosphoesterase
MRLVYAADLHGDIDSYRTLLELARVTEARAAIVGGDLLPRAITLRTALQVQRDFIAAQLRPLLEWFRARNPEIDVYLLPGNDDWAAAIAKLDDLEQAGLAFPLHERVYALATTNRRTTTTTRNGGIGSPSSAVRQSSSVAADDLFLAGYACVPITPFSIKDYERRDDGPLPPFSFEMAYTSANGEIRPVDAETLAAQPSIAEALAALAQRSDPQRTILVCHTPPFDTALDTMPRGRHVGSKALRAFIEQHAPPLTLHGHIHESPELSGRYATQLGRTWSINPGHDERRFQAITLDTDDLAGTIAHTTYGRPITS